jgi:hypothetical protein
VTRTILRLELASGGTLELVRAPGQADVIIFVDSEQSVIAVDLTADEVEQLVKALGESNE